ncbi:MAG: DUF72 domain-containing protein [Nocardioidaceae bacterium]
MTQARVGISGWVYPAWRGTFYPKGLGQKRELEYASRHLSSIEINGSFYSLQRPSSFQRWHDETPDGFVFSVKGPRFITHMKKLADAEVPLANFFASGVLALGDKLGPLLWQLPPTLGFDEERLATFFERLPRTTSAAARLAEQHDDKIPEDRALTTASVDQPLRHCLEVRHPSLATERALQVMRDHDVAIVIADTAGKWPMVEELTSDFAYARLHGADELYVSGYTAAALDRWANKVRGWVDSGRDVYVYFDNDAKVHSPYDAQALMQRLGIKRPADLD